MSWSAAHAGEKIQITDSPEQVQLPKESKEFLPSSPGLFPSRIGSSESGKNTVMPQATQPLMIMRNPRLQESLDRRMNWIFDSPNSFDRDRAIEDALGVGENKLENLERKPKGQVERYFEAKKEPKGKFSKNGKESGSDSLNVRKEFDPTGRWKDPAEKDVDQPGGIIPELNPAQLFNWDAAPEPFSTLGSGTRGNSILSRGLRDTGFGQSAVQPADRGLNPELRGFQRNWDLGKSPLGARFDDPMNTAGDATRAIMQPIAARKASVPPPESSQGRLSDSIGIGSSSPASTRPDFFSPSQNRISTPTFSPPAASVSRPPVFQAKPGVLEIPRPKF